jgi:hypothetical protein
MNIILGFCEPGMNGSVLSGVQQMSGGQQMSGVQQLPAAQQLSGVQQMQQHGTQTSQVPTNQVLYIYVWVIYKLILNVANCNTLHCTSKISNTHI